MRINSFIIFHNMEIIVKEEDYNGCKFTATLDDYTNKRYANYQLSITWWWNTEEEAKEQLIEKAKEMIEKIHQIIYK